MKKQENEMQCNFPGCTNEQRAIGLCRPHYNQKNRTGVLKPIRGFVEEDPGPIATPDEVTRQWKRWLSQGKAL